MSFCCVYSQAFFDPIFASESGGVGCKQGFGVRWCAKTIFRSSQDSVDFWSGLFVFQWPWDNV